MFSNQLDYYMVQNKCYIVNIIKILSTEQENRDPILCVYNLISFYPISAYSNLEIHLIFWLNYLDKITCNKFTRFSFIFLLLPKQKKTQSSVTSRPCHGKSPDDMLKYPVTWHTEMTHQRTITNFCLPFQHLLSERLASLGIRGVQLRAPWNPPYITAFWTGIPVELNQLKRLWIIGQTICNVGISALKIANFLVASKSFFFFLSYSYSCAFNREFFQI